MSSDHERETGGKNEGGEGGSWSELVISFQMYKFINLPLLDKMTKEFDMDLSDVTLVTSHHILESNYSLMNYLFSK
jgi:hypothetical protein